MGGNEENLIMHTGMVFTSFVSFLVFLSASLAGFSIFKKRPKEDKALFSYSIFLMLTACVWFFVGLCLFSFWLGKENLAKLFFTMDQILVFCSGVPLSYYLSLKIWGKDGFSKIVSILYSLGAFGGIVLLLIFGVTTGESTYFASKFQPNTWSFLIFVLLIAPLGILALIDTIGKFIRWARSKETAYLYDFFYTLVIVIYLCLGFFDEQGLIVDWPLVFFRLIFTAVFFLAYLTFSFQSLSREEFVSFNE